MASPIDILLVAGTRPNFVKIAPLMAACKAHPQIEAMLVHTGQHYDDCLNGSFFRELGIPDPDVNLNIGSGSHVTQTAGIMAAFETVLREAKPDSVLVVGDVNSTLACALAAAQSGVQVFHVEAGLRSHDRSMPEELNRVVVDHLSDLLFVSEQSGIDNLTAEGIDAKTVHFVGNVMIDTLERFRPAKRETEPYAVLTVHRQENMPRLPGILEAVEAIARDMPVIWPRHPRVKTGAIPGVQIVEPMGYREFITCLSGARVVLTDSGGVQEETTALGVPCLTLRDNTERPSTIHEGTNLLVGTEPSAIIDGYKHATHGVCGKIPALWDGHAAERIVEVIARERS